MLGQASRRKRLVPDLSPSMLADQPLRELHVLGELREPLPKQIASSVGILTLTAACKLWQGRREEPTSNTLAKQGPAIEGMVQQRAPLRAKAHLLTPAHGREVHAQLLCKESCDAFEERSVGRITVVALQCFLRQLQARARPEVAFLVDAGILHPILVVLWLILAALVVRVQGQVSLQATHRAFADARQYLQQALPVVALRHQVQVGQQGVGVLVPKPHHGIVEGIPVLLAIPGSEKEHLLQTNLWTLSPSLV
mmetsp:Transcript_19564/g.46239  ORF Transcript_19564/g.46239 Transcript_19564/m.46239 type:complete len:253 (+) Transcript_19564:2061-2819(+)